MAQTQHTQEETDAKAAFTGLIVGAIVLFLIVRGIVFLTNQHYAGEASHVEATK
jgi:hypothetical protein